MSSANPKGKDDNFSPSPVPELKRYTDSAKNEPEVDPRGVLRKLDLRIMPLVSVLYMLSFLDRTNIGNAKVAGLTADLHLTGLQYNLCAAAFFIPFCFFEVPSNLALKKFKPSRWIPIIMFWWGIVMVSMAFVKSFAGLITARIFLGMTEAGLTPGVTFYICTWYPRAAQGQRISMFSATTSFAGAFGGILAFGIQKLDGTGGLAGWSWIFLLEGLATVLVALVAYCCMHDSPENASFLTEDERQWLVETLQEDNARLSKEFKWEFLFQALRDPHSYLMIGVFLFIDIPAYAFALFVPTIVAGLGFSAARAQLLSVPPYAAACVITLLFGMLSDRFLMRGPFVLAGATIALVGSLVLYLTTTPGAGYVGTVIAACGLYPSIPCIIAWIGGNFGGEMKRAVALAMVVGVGSLAGVASSFTFRAQDSPLYRSGHVTDISCLCVAIVFTIIAMCEFSRLNRKKRAQCEREGIAQDKANEFVEMGDASPLYRYMI